AENRWAVLAWTESMNASVFALLCFALLSSVALYAISARELWRHTPAINVGAALCLVYIVTYPSWLLFIGDRSSAFPSRSKRRRPSSFALLTLHPTIS